MRARCRHFGTCGGCAFQDMAADTYRDMKREEVKKALAGQRVGAPVAALIETAAATRRRATLRAVKNDDELLIGFNAPRSHVIVDMQECLVLTPALVGLVHELRGLLRRLLKTGEQAQITVTETGSGFDLSLDLPGANLARDAPLLANWARARDVARISVNGETAVHLANPTICIGDANVLLQQGTFLQPSSDAETILQTAVLDIMQGARRIADLFAGCGTFALVLAKCAHVHAVDLDDEALRSLGDAARKTDRLKPVTIETRDLFRRPLRPDELNRFDAVVIDPPRAGARAQVELIAQSRVIRLAYVSCNPQTFARDAAILTQAGFHLTGVTPVDQFRWSNHIELVGAFERSPGWSQPRKN